MLPVAEAVAASIAKWAILLIVVGLVLGLGIGELIRWML